MSLTGRTFALLSLLAAVLGVAAEHEEPGPGPQGILSGGSLDVIEDRVVDGWGEDVDRRYTAEQLKALRQQYIDRLVQDCRDGASGALDTARCDDMVVVRGPAAEAEDDPGMPPITMADLARFTPLVGELVVEPDGWGVVGTPTNFYATAETHTMDGELFDTPIRVRWTPSSYVFDYGDGSVEETDASGAAWRGTEESWTETSTSHTYSSTDDATASVTVVFTAEVDAGQGWLAVPGTLPVEAPAVSVKVFEVDTVLTDGDCMANPRASGCG